jgi:transmembrane sensor
MSQQRAATDEAARWVVRLDSPECTARERAQFEHWLIRDPAHRAAYLEMERAWSQADRLRTRRPIGGEVNLDLFNDQARSRREHHWLGFGIAAGILVTLAAAWMIWLPRATPVAGWETYRTQVGELQHLTLDDGSIVQLNTDSELRVRLGTQLRALELKRGEAAFTVAPDRLRPFEVQAAQTLVRAVGTEFAVRLRPMEAVELTVTEGQVLVTDAGRPRLSRSSGLDGSPLISAGHVGLAGPKGVSIRPAPPSDLQHKLAWRGGEIVFSGERLDEAIAEVNRYNVRRLVLRDPELATLRVGGRFRASDLDSFVGALEQSFGIKARPMDEGNVILLLR